MMQEYDLAKRPGRWRLGAIRVRDEEKREDVYEGPSVDVVPELMNEMIDSLNGADRSVPGIVQAAMGHLNLVMIHPYSDGNGRMARCLQTLILARTGTLAPVFSSIEEYLGRNTPEYYSALSIVGGGSWQPERDVRPWIRFCLIAHFRQATTLGRRFKETQLLWDLLEEDIARRRLPDRVIFALADAAMGYRVRNATYRPSAEINNQIASRDFKLLVQAGLLVPVGEKRGRSYAASPALEEMRGRTRLAKATEDPFAPNR
jgi:Fic family protein